MKRWKMVFSLAFLCGLLGLSATGDIGMARAETQSGQEPVLLTVAQEGGTSPLLSLSLQDLQGFDIESFTTATIWTTGPQEFTGVPLVDILARLQQEQGLKTTSIKARAVNDYMVEVPVSDAVEGGAMIAFQRNGKLMSLRNKGPLWVVYPYDSNAAYRSEATYSRSVWQLDRLIVETTLQ